WFRYSASDPGSCNDAFGSRAPLSGGTALGSSSTSQSYSQGLSGLSNGTRYYYCAIAQNGVGLSFGAVLNFVTPAVPSLVTQAPTNLAATSVTLNGTVNPNGSGTTAYYR